MIPMAYVYPREMRATRDLLRRRNYLMRRRADLLAHIRNTNAQCNMREFGRKIAYRANREGIAEQFRDPNVQVSIRADLALIDHYDQLLNEIELFVLRNAKRHDPDALYLLRTVHVIGKIISLVILYEIIDISRFPRVQDFVSYARLVRCARESAGKRHGTSGRKIGNVHLECAFSEAAVLFLRDNPAGMKYKKRLESKHGKAKAHSITAHKRGRAVYYILKHDRAFSMDTFLGS